MAEKLAWWIECWECATEMPVSGSRSGRSSVDDRKSDAEDAKRSLHKFQRLERLLATCERCVAKSAASSGTAAAAEKKHSSRCLSARREPATPTAAATTKHADPVARRDDHVNVVDDSDDQSVCGYVHVMVPSHATSVSPYAEALDNVDDDRAQRRMSSSSSSSRVYVEQIWVEPHWRQAGVATQLMRRVIDELGEQFDMTLTVCPVDIPLECLADFYRRLGFVSGGDPPMRLGCAMIRPASNFVPRSESRVSPPAP